MIAIIIQLELEALAMECHEEILFWRGNSVNEFRGFFGLYCLPVLSECGISHQWHHQGGACGFIYTQSIHKCTHPLHVCNFVVYLAYQGVNPLYALFTTLPQPVTSMPVHVHRPSIWKSTKLLYYCT